MPRCLDASGSVREADPHVGALRDRRPDLLTVERPSPRHLRGTGGERREIRTRARLAEELTPDDIATEGRHHEAFTLFIRAVGDDRRERPGGDREVGTAQVRLLAHLVDHQLLDRAGVPTPWSGPVRSEESFFGERASLFGGVLRRGDRSQHGAQPVVQLVGLGRKLDAQSPARPRQGESCGLGTQRSGAAEELAERRGPPQVDVRVVLPGETHPAEDLNGAVGCGDVAVECQRRSELHRKMGLRPGVPVDLLIGNLVGRGGRVPRRGHRLLELDQHVGEAMLHALELADRPAELVAIACVSRRDFEAPACAPDGFGGCDEQGEIADPLGRDRGQDPGRRDDGRLERPRRRRPCEVEARHSFDGPRVVPFEEHPHCRSLRLHRRQHQGHHGAVDDRLDRSFDDQRAVGPAGADQTSRSSRAAVGRRHRIDERRGRRALDDRGEELLARRAVLGEHRSDDDGGRPRARRGRPPQLLGGHRELHQSRALSSELLGQMDPERAVRGELLPERRECVGRSLERLADDGSRTPRLAPPSKREAELLVLVADPDRHDQAPKRCSRWSIDQVSHAWVPRITTAIRIIIRF